MTGDKTADDATDATTIDPETLARLPEFYVPTLSPDASELAFFHDRTGRLELYTLALADGEWTQWSDGNVPRNLSGGIAWDPAGDRVYFHRDDDGDEQNDIYAITRDGETEAVIETDGQAQLAAVSPDGRSLAYLSTEAEPLNLCRYDTETGESEQLTDHARPLYPFDTAYSPDGERIAYTTNETDDPENRDAYVVDVDGGEPRQLDVGEPGSEVAVGDWLPDGERLLVGDNSTDRDRVGVYDLRDDAVTWLSDGDAVERPIGVSPDGGTAAVVRTREAADVPVVYDLDSGAGTELDLPEGVARPVGGRDGGFAGDDRLLLAHETGTTRREVLDYDLNADEAETVLSADYGDFDPETFVEPEYVTYESTDGLTIDGLLYEPRDDPGPAVVKVHGGPASQSEHEFDVLAQVLAAEGYTVLEPNYRGSTGRGREFKNRIRNDWGGMEQVDVRRGAEWLADRDAVDPDRIAVFGGSYGGYTAYCQLTMHPEPWAAGVAWVGMTDLLSLYEKSMPHFKTTLEDYLGDPEEDEQFYRERSPIEHVDALDAPVYVVHGVNDPRCPISQARRFRDALEDRGLTAGEDGDFEYTELGAEGHGSTDIEQKVRAYGRIADFLDRRL